MMGLSATTRAFCNPFSKPVNRTCEFVFDETWLYGNVCVVPLFRKPFKILWVYEYFVVKVLVYTNNWFPFSHACLCLPVYILLPFQCSRLYVAVRVKRDVRPKLSIFNCCILTLLRFAVVGMSILNRLNHRNFIENIIRNLLNLILL